MRAAIATDVRLKEEIIPLADIDPIIPNIALATGVRMSVNITVTSGVRRAAPRVMTKREPILNRRLFSEKNIITADSAIKDIPVIDFEKKVRCSFFSFSERLITVLGGADVASSAGSNAARNVARRPSIIPLKIIKGFIDI